MPATSTTAERRFSSLRKKTISELGFNDPDLPRANTNAASISGTVYITVENNFLSALSTSFVTLCAS